MNIKNNDQSLCKIKAKNNDGTINAIIEISANTNVKYEFNKECNMVEVDRFLMTTMSYPANYGFIPNTLGGDGDPIDVLIISSMPIIPGALIKIRPIGVLLMEDESGIDEKVLCLPTAKSDPIYANINSYDELPQITLDKIRHFFERYKDLEEGKWVKLDCWASKEKALEVIEKAIIDYKE